MNPLIRELLQHGPIVTDGAWGTQLQARGLATGECPDAWNLSNPDAVEAVARNYVEAGSQIILTNTFGANRVLLDSHGLGEKTAEINCRGSELSRRAADGRARVFASIGPSGKMILSGEVTEEELGKAFAEQAAALAEGGADAIVIETMADLAEARLALRGAKETGVAVVACMVFDSGADMDRTMMGVTPEQAAEELTAAGADVIGANCGQGIAGFVSICQRMRASTDRPIWIKANAGLPELVDGQPVYKTTTEEFAGYTSRLIEAGASFIGGCCGTNPKFIEALRHEVSSITG